MDQIHAYMLIYHHIHPQNIHINNSKNLKGHVGCDCNFGIVKCKCCMGMCNPIMNPTNSRDTDEVGDDAEQVNP